MSKNNGNSRYDSLETRNYEQLFNLIFRYSRSAMLREIAHSINNILTVLSMQHSMLNKSLNKGDAISALKRTDVMRDVINDLKRLSEDLAQEKQIPPNYEDVAINQLINETLDRIQILSSIAKCEITTKLSQDPDIYNIDANSIRMLLLSVLLNSCSIYLKPVVTITTSLERKSGNFFITVVTKEGKTGRSAKYPRDISQKVGKNLGEIPLRLMKGFVESVNRNVSLNFNESGSLGFICTITPEIENTNL